MLAPVSVIVLTYNEEANIVQCLENVKEWTDDIIIIDSNSKDRTIDIAKSYTNNIYQIDAGHWAEIRNWAMQNANIKYEWVLFLDADEMISDELKKEINEKIAQNPTENGFYFKRRFIFLDKWLKHGGLYPEVLRLYRYKYTRYIKAGDVEYAVVDGKTGKLKSDMIHKDLKPVSVWIDKHNRISERAREQYFIEKGGKSSIIDKMNSASQIEGGTRKHLIKEKIWDKIPLTLRAFVIFVYTYVFMLGFLDGIEGFYYHALQSFWYRLLIAVKVREYVLKTVR